MKGALRDNCRDRYAGFIGTSLVDRLVVSTPDTGHVLHRLMGRSWLILQPLQHGAVFKVGDRRAHQNTGSHVAAVESTVQDRYDRLSRRPDRRHERRSLSHVPRNPKPDSTSVATDSD